MCLATKFRVWRWGLGVWAMVPDVDGAISPGRDHGERKSQPDEAAWRNRQVRTSASTAGVAVRADMKRVVKRAEICEARVVRGKTGVQPDT